MSSVTGITRGLLGLVSLLAVSLLPSGLQAQDSGLPLTRSERSGFTETTRYDEVMAFVREVTDGQPNMHLTTMGYTSEGRPLPLVVVGQPRR